MRASRSDALVLFGVTGDLAHKMIFPAPNSNRMAESSLSPKSSSPLDANRWQSAALKTGAGAQFVDGGGNSPAALPRIGHSARELGEIG